jgi:hypothetical protein
MLSDSVAVCQSMLPDFLGHSVFVLRSDEKTNKKDQPGFRELFLTEKGKQKEITNKSAFVLIFAYCSR